MKREIPKPEEIEFQTFYSTCRKDKSKVWTALFDTKRGCFHIQWGSPKVGQDIPREWVARWVIKEMKKNKNLISCCGVYPYSAKTLDF